ncbi:MAG: hypothetical protein KAH21_02030, partial [Spirochaetaceae bacterium]|nr:hypothetical protein [Spirochaetaceae bacterium]
MKQRGVFLIGLILIIIYYFLFPRASGKELVITPDILTKLEPTEFTASPSSLAVRNGDQAGFLDMDHELLSFFSSNRMAVDKHWIAVSGNEGLSLMEPDGRLIVRIPDFAYPIARNGNLFLYRSDTGVLSKINPVNGNLLWRK